MPTMMKNVSKKKTLAQILSAIPSKILKGINKRKTRRTVAVVAAGGKGERLYPFSTLSKPKQFCEIGGIALITSATKRIIDTGIVRPEDCFVFVCDENQKSKAYKCLKKLGVKLNHIIIYRDTLDYAGCMLQIAYDLVEKFGYDRKTVAINTPSDNYLTGEGVADCFERLVESAYSNGPTILGIGRDKPEEIMPYGNAIYEPFINSRNSFRVRDFKEKPDYEDAVDLLAQGNSAVNTGINAWTLGDIIDAYDIKNLGETGGLKTDELMNAFGDNLFMEVAGKDVDWDDLGSFDSIVSKLQATPNHRNVSIGTVKRTGCLDSAFIAANDIIEIDAHDIEDEYVVANMDNDGLVILVFDPYYAQEVKNFARSCREGVNNIYAVKATGNKLIESPIKTYCGFLGINGNSVYVDEEPIENGTKYIVHIRAIKQAIA